MKAPNIICDSVCQFASSFSSKDRISFVASVDIGKVPFLRVLLAVFGGLATHRCCVSAFINAIQSHHSRDGCDR